MDDRQREFLKNIETDMTAQSSHRPVGTKRKVGRTLLSAAAMLVASASMFAFSATAVQASPNTIQSDCFTPDHVKEDHSKTCPGGIAFVSYKYEYEFHVHGNVWCFVFDATYFGCGGLTPIGEKLSCAAGH